MGLKQGFLRSHWSLSTEREKWDILKPTYLKTSDKIEVWKNLKNLEALVRWCIVTYCFAQLNIRVFLSKVLQSLMYTCKEVHFPVHKCSHLIFRNLGVCAFLSVFFVWHELMISYYWSLTLETSLRLLKHQACLCFVTLAIQVWQFLSSVFSLTQFVF